jgi:hypothetical protein
MIVMGKKKKPTADRPAKDRGPVLYLRLTDDHERALQAFIDAQRIKPDRTAVGLAALEELLAKEGFWPMGGPK